MSKTVVKLDGAQGNAVHSYSEEEKTAFVEFINQQLAEDPDLQGVLPINSEGEDIFKVVHDGILLAKMVNVAKENTIELRKLNRDKAKLNNYKILENQNQTIGAAKAIGCSIVNVGPNDIMEGRPVLVFSLMWQLIRIKLTSKINLKDHPELYRLLEDGESLEDFLKLPPEQILLRWFNYHLKNANHSGRRVTNFSGDVKDSENYTVLLAQIAPQHCNKDPLNETDPLARANLVLGNSEKLGCKRFIKPADIASGNARLNLSFTAELFNTWPALAPLENIDDKLKLLLDEEDSSDSREERAFRNWMNNIGIDKFINNLFTDLIDGVALLQIIDKIKPGLVDWKKVNNPIAEGVRAPFKRNENTTYAIDLAKGPELKCSLVGIGGADISGGKKKETLAIVWQLRRKHLLNFLQNMSKGGKEYTEASLVEEANAKVAAAGKSSRITGLNDPSLKTSRFLLDLISSIEPRAVDEEIYQAGGTDEDNKQNARFAIAAARAIGASIFVLWEDIVEVKQKMILTFIGAVLSEGHKVTDQ